MFEGQVLNFCCARGQKNQTFLGLYVPSSSITTPSAIRRDNKYSSSITGINKRFLFLGIDSLFIRGISKTHIAASSSYDIICLKYLLLHIREEYFRSAMQIRRFANSVKYCLDNSCCCDLS